jgi:hypothetical protein
MTGLPLPDDRHAVVAATAQYMYSLVERLRELDFGDIPPAAVYRAEEGSRDGAV